MKNTLRESLILYALGCSLILVSCNSKRSGEADIATDSASVARGEKIFNQTCVSCHTFNRDAIGPALGGVTSQVPASWLRTFIKDPAAVIASGDARAQELLKKYKAVMPAFGYYKDEEIDGLIAYLHTQTAGQKNVVPVNANALKDPIPEGIPQSDLVVEMKLVKQMPATSEEKPMARITKFCSRPDRKEFFVLDLRGKLYRLQGGKAAVYMDMAALMPDFINAPGHATGFGSFAFHPGFAKNGLLFTTHTEKAGSAPADFTFTDSLKVKLQWVVEEWKTNNPGAFPFRGKRRELFRVDMVGQSHGVQEITFNPLSKPGDNDYGLLYIGIGDGGSAERGILFLSKGPEKIWSSILRIDPMGRNSVNGNYGIPDNNPFAHSANGRALGEVYAYGFRNPHRITWTKSGKMLASNIGQHNIEELNLILPGHDYGWPTREGSFVVDLPVSTHDLFPLSKDDSTFHKDYPVAEYDHDEG
ncbi:MAG TPA: PQQ-dependent sugar dehydrogenase, partial [Chryseosolibacter sp.]